MRRAALGFWVAGAAAALAVASLLLRDPRATAADKRWLFSAVALAIVSGLRLIVRGRGVLVADLVTAVGLVGVALGTIRIGGLAFVVSVFFLLLAAFNDRRRESAPSRVVATTIIGISVILLGLAFFSPGGAIFIVMPATIPLLIWSVASCVALSGTCAGSRSGGGGGVQSSHDAAVVDERDDSCDRNQMMRRLVPTATFRAARASYW